MRFSGADTRVISPTPMAICGRSPTIPIGRSERTGASR
jgi:hypothetical protein